MIPVKNKAQCRRFPWVTLLLGAINAGVFIYELALPPAMLDKFFAVFGLIPANLFQFNVLEFNGISNYAVLPIFTSIFIHGGFFHLILNMWTLYLFAPCMEDRLGHFRFMVFYFLCGMGASLMHAVIHSKSVVPTVGASGAIAGVLGAYFVLLPLSKIVVLVPLFFLPLFFEIPAFFYLLIWFVSQLHSGAWILIGGAPNHGGIAFWAHISGFLIGIYLLSVFLPSKKRLASS
ncbi:MAG: rhomboid family intramembrane serine protease [bacterium]